MDSLDLVTSFFFFSTSRSLKYYDNLFPVKFPILIKSAD